MTKYSLIEANENKLYFIFQEGIGIIRTMHNLTENKSYKESAEKDFNNFIEMKKAKIQQPNGNVLKSVEL